MALAEASLLSTLCEELGILTLQLEDSGGVIACLALTSAPGYYFNLSILAITLKSSLIYHKNSYE